MKRTKEHIRKSVPFFGTTPWRIFKVVVLLVALVGGMSSADRLQRYLPALVHGASEQPEKAEVNTLADDQVAKNSPSLPVVDEVVDSSGENVQEISSVPVSEQAEVSQVVANQGHYESAQDLFSKNHETLRRLTGE